MKLPLLLSAVGLVGASLLPLRTAAAEDGMTVKPILDLRVRYETVDQQGFDNEAEALTARIRAGFDAAILPETRFLIDFEHVEALMDDYNSTTNGKTGLPVIPDPETTELNRLHLTNTSLAETEITLGRQRIVHGNAWFVGNVGWRQNEQTFDALRVVNTSIEGLRVEATYIDQVNRIFGDDSPAGRWNSSSAFLTADYTPALEQAEVSLSGFAYLLDFETAPAASSSTLGLALSGKHGPLKASARYARQQDHGDQPVSYEADYYQLEAGLSHSGFTAAAGFEVLGSDDGVQAFQRPLATLHKFNGFADVFLVTPATGLEDAYLSAAFTTKWAGPADKVTLAASYHDFSANSGGARYGSEIDLVASATFGRFTALAKFADYEADEFAGDRQKLWLSFEWAY